MNTKNAVSLSSRYVDLKIEELQLAFEYLKRNMKKKRNKKECVNN